MKLLTLTEIEQGALSLLKQVGFIQGGSPKISWITTYTTALAMMVIFGSKGWKCNKIKSQPSDWLATMFILYVDFKWNNVEKIKLYIT